MVQESSRVCPRCRHTNRTEDNYCGNCGLLLTVAEGNQNTVPSYNTTPPDAIKGGIAPVSPPPPASPTQPRNVRRIILFSVVLILLAGTFTAGIYLGKRGTPPPTPTAAITPTSTPTSAIHTITLNAQTSLPGMDTGVSLTAGERLNIKAAGLTTHGNPAICNNALTNPDGVSMVNGKPCRFSDSTPVYPDAPYGILLASIVPAGTTPPGVWFVVGSSYSAIVWVSGELYLIYNDGACCYSDNSGSYQVTITVEQG